MQHRLIRDIPEVYFGRFDLHVCRQDNLNYLFPFPEYKITDLNLFSEYESQLGLERIAIIMSANQRLFQNLRTHLQSLYSYKSVNEHIFSSAHIEKEIQRILTT